MKKQDDFLMVSIRCTTYNQESYIRQCLDGFVMQKTNFRFEAIVHDDASTDGTPAIIREYAEKYPDIIKPIFETENQYSKHGSIRRIMDEACKGKYIALCEGDDYWTDPLKLQKQVDLMEQSDDYGMCFTQYGTIPTKKISNSKPSNFNDVKTEEIINRKFSVGTQTVIYRKKAYDKLPKFYLDENFQRGDFPLWVEFSFFSKVVYLDDTTAIYRITGESASHSHDLEKEISFLRKGFECSEFYVIKLGLNIRIDWKIYYIAAMKACYNHNSREFGNRLLKESIRKNCLSLKEVLFYMAIHLSLIKHFINLLYS